MAAITPLRSLDMLDQLKQEAPLYQAAAGSAGTFDKSSMADYTDAILTWWRTNGSSFPAWDTVGWGCLRIQGLLGGTACKLGQCSFGPSCTRLLGRNSSWRPCQ